MALITVNFHPDRHTSSGVSVLQAFRDDPYLRSQYETQTSNGGLSAYEGGARWQWESRLFKQRYDKSEAIERPKYGALNYLNRGSGASSRFGSAYFQLKAHVLDCATFCYPDSYYEPENLTNVDGLAQLMKLADQHDDDPLDQYIEAHIHGQVSLADDVECLVLDPAFRGSRVESEAKQLNLDIRWHNGFSLAVNELEQYSDYRGEKIVALAKSIASDGILDCRVLSDAEKSGWYAAQDLKKVWHYLACYGDNNQ